MPHPLRPSRALQVQPQTLISGCLDCPEDRIDRSLWTTGPIAIALGALSALSFAPWHWLIFLAIGLSGLLVLLDHTATSWRALVLGWLFGVGHFVAGLHWIVESFEVDSERFGALAIPAVLALSAYLASFPAVACLATKLFGSRGLARVLVFAAAWSAAEWLRGTLFTGFPWNLVAYVWMPHIAPLQAAAVVGAYGLGFVTVVLASLPSLMVPVKQAVVVSLWPVVALFFLVIGVLWIFGEMRLANAVEGEVTNVRFRLVQAGIPQRDKWDPAMRERIIDRYRELSAAPAADSHTHLVWPESALPFVFSGSSVELRRAVTGVIPAGGVLLTGADRRVARIYGEPVLHNSLVAINGNGDVVAAYDKVRLVPFGEYMPLRRMLPLDNMTGGAVDFIAGAGRMVLSIPGLPSFAPLICYEAIFPAGRVEFQDPLWLLNVTNDAWFGTSAGPYQHFAIARMRAVEAGVPLVRAANTGISAVVDAYGRTRASLGLNQVGVLDSGLPLAIPERTLYARWGETPVKVIVLLILGTAAVKRLQRRRLQPPSGALN